MANFEAFLWNYSSSTNTEIWRSASSQPIRLWIIIYCEWFSVIARIIDSWRDFVGIVQSLRGLRSEEVAQKLLCINQAQNFTDISHTYHLSLLVFS